MSQIQQIKDAHDIVALIGSRLTLQRAGSNWRGLCPFHSEKSPSFFVNEALQRYKCFGCGESGDIYTFLEKYEGMTFYESLQFLADEAGITLEKRLDGVKSTQDEQRERILAVLQLAKEYYHYLLTEHKAGEPARTYLRERGLSNETIKIFQLGFALPEWEGLTKYLHRKKKYETKLLEQAGLIIQGRQGSFYDRFRDRIIFPLRNHRGQVVGFSGRTLSQDVKEAKYINSPETQVYHKSKMLFGYHELLQFIRKDKQVIVVEGEFDVLSSTQAHVNNIVAIKGSALTADHAKLLSRVAKTIILALDTDSAGIEATKKSISVLRSTDLELRVVKLPEGKDPDDLARLKPKVWRQAIKQSITAYEFLIEVAINKYDPNSPSGKRSIIQELAPELNLLEHAVELEFYLKTLAKKLDVKIESIKTDLQRFAKRLSLKKMKTSEAYPDDNYDAQDSMPEDHDSKSRLKLLERYLLFILFHLELDWLDNQAQDLTMITWTLPGALQIVKKYLKSLPTLTKLKNQEALAKFSRQLSEDLQQNLFEYTANPKYLELIDNLDLKKEWQKTLKDLKSAQIQGRISEISAQLSELDRKASKTPAEEKLSDELLKEVVVLRGKVN